MNIDPLFPNEFTFPLIAGIVIITMVSIAGLGGKVTDNTRNLLVSLKALSAVALVMLLLRPSWVQEENDPAAFKVVVLADLSASMLTQDSKGQPSRLQTLRPAIEQEEGKSPNWLAKLRDQWRVEVLSFAGNVFPLASGSWDTVASQNSTDLGSALTSVLDQDGDPVGGVFLLTDGKDNAGIDMSKTVGSFKQAGVPINIVGIGDHRPEGDLEVYFEEDEIKGVAREEMTVKATVKNHFNHSVQTTATLYDGKKVVARQPVDVERHATQELEFTYLRETAGARNLRVTLDSPTNDSDPSTDSDFTVAMVEAPEEFRILFLSNRMNLNYRYIKNVLSPEERMKFHSIIQLSEDKFLPYGPDIPTSWPEKPEFFNQFDVLMLDTLVLESWPDILIQGIVDFVSLRGGGLLLYGPPDPAKEKLGSLLPILDTETETIRDDRTIEMDAEPIFDADQDIDHLKLFLPGKLPASVATRVKLAARKAAYLRSKSGAALALQAYGAGKCAYWGSEHDWRWAMKDEEGTETHKTFWYGLAAWLGSGGEDRIRADHANKVHTSGEPVPLDIELLGADFEAADDALVEAIIEGSDGSPQRVQLFPSSNEPGLYKAAFHPPATGDYRITYKCTFPESEPLEHEAFFGVGMLGGESREVTFEEGFLQDLARLTGGKYRHYPDMDTTDWPLAQSLPKATNEHSLTDNLLFLCLLAGLIGSEWIYRRQSGLR